MNRTEHLDAAKQVAKDDIGKSRMDLLPPEFLTGTAYAMGHGANKYGDNNWAHGTEWGRYYAAAMRHLVAWWGGDDYDPESANSHLAHAACCIAFLMAYEARGVGTDDRPGSTPANREQSDECPECGRAAPCTASGCFHPLAMRGRVE